jgi:hypothetical protein
MTSPPSRYLTMEQAARYVARIEGVPRTRQTVYNWARKGVRDTKLRTRTRANQMYTTAAWITEFLRAIR